MTTAPFADPDISAEHLPDGSLLLTCRQPLDDRAKPNVLKMVVVPPAKICRDIVKTCG